MTKIRKVKQHQDNNVYTPKSGSLMQRGNYAMFRILSIINAAGPAGITTVVLLKELKSKSDRTNAIIRKAQELGYIDRIKGESEHGHFSPVNNIITDKGKTILSQSFPMQQ